MATTTYRARCGICPWHTRSDEQQFALDSLHAHVDMLHRRTP